MAIKKFVDAQTRNIVYGATRLLGTLIREEDYPDQPALPAKLHAI